MSKKPAAPKTAAEQRLEAIKSLIREMEMIGDMVMTAAVEAQEAPTQDGAVGTLLGVEREINALPQLFQTVLTLHRTRA